MWWCFAWRRDGADLGGSSECSQKIPIESDKLNPEPPGQPQVGGVIDGQLLGLSQENGVTERDAPWLHGHPGEQGERRDQLPLLSGMPEQLLPTGVGNLIGDERRRDKRIARDPFEDALGIRLAEQDRRNRGGVDDFQ